MNKLFMIVFLLLSMIGTTNAKSGNDTYVLEEKMDLFEKIVNLQLQLGIVQNSNFWNEDKKMNSMALVDTLWSKGWDSTKEEDLELVRKSLKKLELDKFEIADKVRLFLMNQKLGENLVNNSEFMKEIYEEARAGKLERRELYTLLNYRDQLEDLGFGNIYKEVDDNYGDDVSPYEEAQNKSNKGLTKSILKDIVFSKLDLGDYGRGKYSFGPKLFMLCRQNRNYPCMMIMKDSRNQLVRNEDGSVWTHKALGQARRNRAYNVKNGYTPAGVYTMDSVMPQANKQRLYGKNRRVILNFISRGSSELKTKALLPESSHSQSWWKQAVVARDVGRNLLRIHGTGLRSIDSSASYYPFVRTSGCIAQRENTYGGKTYNDQRILLDKMMEASSFTPAYKNEAHIKGLLYVIEIDGQRKPVEKSHIEEFLDL